MQEHELISCCSHMTLFITSGLEHVRALWQHYLLFHPQWAFFSIFLIFKWIWFVQVHSECEHIAMQSYPALSFRTTVSRYTSTFGNSGPNAGSCMLNHWDQDESKHLMPACQHCWKVLIISVWRALQEMEIHQHNTQQARNYILTKVKNPGWYFKSTPMYSELILKD